MIEKSSPHRRMSLTSKHIAGELFPKSKGVRQVTILATVQVSQLPAMEKFKQILTEKLLSNYRFTSIPTELGGGKWVWKEGTTKVDLDLHLIQAEIVTSSAASSSTQPTPTLTEYLESIVFREWDFKSPLWRIHLLKNVSDFVDEGVAVGLQQNLNREGSYSSSASAVIIEVHHAIGDGISLMQLAHSLFTDASGNSISDWTNSKKEPRRQTVMDKLRYISSIPKQWIKANSIFLLKDTQHAAKQPHSPCFSFHKQRKIIFFPTMSLDVIKKIKNGNPGSTVNDVLLSTMTGALTRYLEYKGQLQKKQMRIRSLLLYSQPKNDGDLHNSFCFISTPLAVSKKHNTPLLRLNKTSRIMSNIKTSSQPTITSFLQRTVSRNWFPAALRKRITFEMFANHSIVFSNVPGIQQPMLLCEQEVVGIQPVVPNILHEVTLVSYNGKVFMNMVAACDGEGKCVIDEPDVFVDLFTQEIKELSKDSGVAESPIADCI